MGLSCLGVWRYVGLKTSFVVGLGLLVYVVLYFVYGKRLEREVVRADGGRVTPAWRLYDGVDFVPAERPVLFGHHFASIAGAAPIVGPVVMGYLMYRVRVGMVVSTVVGLFLLGLSVWLGFRYPLLLSAGGWYGLLFVYYQCL